MGRLVVYALLVGTVATFVGGFYYGRVNHIEQLPQIMRAMDGTYLTHDFAVNSTTGYGPRFFYTWLLALLGRVFSLPAVFLVLTCLQNAGVALVTFVAARRLAKGSELAAALACVLVLSVRGVRLGEADYLVLPALIPASLVTGAALLSVWLGILGRPLAAALAALPAVLIHPLLGLLCGGLGIGTAGLAELPGAGAGRRRAVRGAAVMAAFALAGVLLWILPGGRDELSARQFLDIYGSFRAPHHIMPSRFPPTEYLAMAVFMAAATLAWLRGYRSPDADRKLLLRMVIPSGMVLLLWLGGYVFVELLPSRLWITMQTFRLVVVVKWFGLLLIATAAARMLADQPGPGAPVAGSVMLAGSGFAQPFLALWGQVAAVRSGLAAALMLVAALLLQVLLGPNPKELHALAATGVMSYLFFRLRRPALRYAATVGLAVLWVGLIAVNRDHRLPLAGTLLGYSAPTFTLGQAAGAEQRLARFVRGALPEDAVFLTPPDFGQFRLTARRAIVVDFKYAMPTDSAMLEWRRRLADCYGEVGSEGWGAASEMDRNYRVIDDSRLTAISVRYGATHAILYRETPTSMPVLYEDPRYRVVGLMPVVSILAFRVADVPPADPSAYFEQLKARAGEAGRTGDGYYLLVDRQLSVEQAAAQYESAVAAGRLPSLGRQVEAYCGSGPDGAPVTALFFRPGN